MSKILSQPQLEQYCRDGFAFPVPVLEAGEVRALRVDLEYWEKQQGHPLDYPEKSKSYLLYRWADTLVHHPKVLDAVEDASVIVVGVSSRWRSEGLGATRRELVRNVRRPVLLVHRGPRPGGLAPPESRTRYTWSLGH